MELIEMRQMFLDVWSYLIPLWFFGILTVSIKRQLSVRYSFWTNYDQLKSTTTWPLCSTADHNLNESCNGDCLNSKIQNGRPFHRKKSHVKVLPEYIYNKINFSGRKACRSQSKCNNSTTNVVDSMKSAKNNMLA